MTLVTVAAPLPLKGTGFMPVCVFRFSWVISVVFQRSARARGDAPRVVLFVHHLCFSILKSQESP